MEKMPQELVDNVVKYLSPQSRLNAMEAGFILSDQAIRHSQAWRKIFKNFDWLETAVWVGANPVLVGPKADAFLNNNDEPEIYLVLLPMDYSGDLQYHFSNSRCEYEQVFLDGLQEYHEYDRELAELHFQEPKITINISGIIEPTCRQARGLEYTNVQHINKVFNEDATTLAIYYTDTYKAENIRARTHKRKVKTYLTAEDLAGEAWTLNMYWVLLKYCHYNGTVPESSSHGMRWLFTPICPPDTWYLSDQF